MIRTWLISLWILTIPWLGIARSMARAVKISGNEPFVQQATLPPLPSAPMKTHASRTPALATAAATDTPAPSLEPTSPPVAPTDTQVPPTLTYVAPTSTAILPTDTDIPPAQTSISPTEIPSTPTSIPPTTVVAPPASTQISPTSTTQPVEVTLSGVEPKRISKETGGALSIYGSGFTAGIAVRLVGFGLLDGSVVNSNAIRAVVPPNVSEGTYSLEIILTDGSVLSMNKVLRIRSDAEKPTKTPTPGPALVYAQPQLLIESAETQPETIRPGSTFTLSLQLINRGDYTATNIRISVSSQELAVPIGSSNLVVIDTLTSNETRLVELPLALNESAAPGYNSLAISLDYSDYYGRDYNSQQNVGLNAGQTSANQPLVLLKSYRTTPESLSPGDAFVLQLEISNVGQNDAYRLLLTLGGSDGSGTYPFAIIDSGNVKFIPSLNAGGTIQLEQRFILDGKAESGVYNLTVTLAYDDSGGEHLTESQVINLLASRRPQLQISFYRTPDTGKVGESLELPVEVVNIGRNLVNVSTMQVSGEDLEIQTGSSFIGSLDGGTSGSMDAQVIPGKSGTLPVLVTVNYLDDFNQPQQITHTLTIEVEQPVQAVGDQAATSQAEQADTLWSRFLRIVRGFFGLGS